MHISFFFNSHISPSFPLFCYDSSGRSEGPCIKAAECDCDEGFLGCPGRAQRASTSVPRGADGCVFVWCPRPGYKGETLHREWLLQISQLYFACQHWLHRYGVSSMLCVPQDAQLISKCEADQYLFYIHIFTYFRVKSDIPLSWNWVRWLDGRG